MGKTSRNEKRKLLASFVGATSVTVLTYSVLRPIIDIGLERATWITMAVGVAISIGLHMVGRRALRDIEEDNS